jgi:hypothetical protein
MSQRRNSTPHPAFLPLALLFQPIIIQKLTLSLNQIDWNKVARDPVLAQDQITNGHAARMRYSRFKKQIDGTAGQPTRKQRNPNPSPRKPKVEKKIKKTKKDESRREGRIEEEAGEDSQSGYQTEGTPEAEVGSSFAESAVNSPIKREPSTGLAGTSSNGSGSGSLYSPTPLHHTPSPSMEMMSPTNEMMTSFGMPGQEQMFPLYSGMGMNAMGAQGIHMGLSNQDPFGELCHWGHQSQSQPQVEGEISVNGQVLVKSEPWEDAYSRA